MGHVCSALRRSARSRILQTFGAWDDQRAQRWKHEILSLTGRQASLPHSRSFAEGKHLQDLHRNRERQTRSPAAPAPPATTTGKGGEGEAATETAGTAQTSGSEASDSVDSVCFARTIAAC